MPTKTLALLFLLLPVSAWATTIVPPSGSSYYTAQNWYCQPVAHGRQTCVNYGEHGAPEP